MNEIWIEAIGMIAGVFTASSFIPQSIKTIKTKDTASISLATYALYVTSCALWLLYGYLLTSFAMVVWNGITLFFAAIILFMKIKHG